MNSCEFSKKIVKWQPIGGRNNLPWQKDKSPYPVWVSEIMLQQTQVDTVLKYYERFIKSFPNIQSLAHSSEENVLKHWSGLGFYRRALHLHKAAKIINQEHNNIFPNTHSELKKLPGIGDSTASAIMSICYNAPEAIFDGNVKRVLSRFFYWNLKEIKDKEMLEIAKKLVCKNQPAIYTQGIMDLGATVCTKHQPLCNMCPVKEGCQSLQKGVIEQTQSKQVAIKNISLHYLIIKKKNQWLFIQRPSKGIWAKMWGFLEFTSEKELEKFSPAKKRTLLTTTQHTLSHRKLTLSFWISQMDYNLPEDQTIYWHCIDKELQIATPKPFTDIFKEYSNETHPL